MKNFKVNDRLFQNRVLILAGLQVTSKKFLILKLFIFLFCTINHLWNQPLVSKHWIFYKVWFFVQFWNFPKYRPANGERSYTKQITKWIWHAQKNEINKLLFSAWVRNKKSYKLLKKKSIKKFERNPIIKKRFIKGVVVAF